MEWSAAMAAVEHQPLRPVYILRGNERSLTDRLIEQIRTGMGREYGLGTGVLRYWFDDSGLSEAIRSCQSVGLFGANDVVVLERCSAFGSSSKNKTDASPLEEYLASPIEDRVFVVTVPQDAWDERKKLVKLAKNHCIVNCQTPKPEVAVDLVQKFAKDKGMSMPADASAELVRRQPSLTMAERELEKLAAFANGRPVQLTDVQETVPPLLEDNVFAWVASVMEGRARDAFHSIEAVLLSGNDPLGLLALIARQLRLMWFAKWGSQVDLSQNAIAQRIGAHPFAVKVAAGQARGATLGDLERMLVAVADAEYAVKSGRREPRQALDWVVMTCLAIKRDIRRAR